MSDDKISALLNDDRYESKDWKQADLVGRIEWLIIMLRAKNEEVEKLASIINDNLVPRELEKAVSDIWKCAGCGIEGFDTDRRCDCATNIVCRGKEGATKTGPSWAKMRIDALEKAIANMQREYDKRGDRIKELEAKLKPALAALGDIGNGEPEWPDDPQKELDWCRNRANEALAKIKVDQP